MEYHSQLIDSATHSPQKVTLQLFSDAAKQSQIDRDIKSLLSRPTHAYQLPSCPRMSRSGKGKTASFDLPDRTELEHQVRCGKGGGKKWRRLCCMLSTPPPPLFAHARTTLAGNRERIADIGATGRQGGARSSQAGAGERTKCSFLAPADACRFRRRPPPAAHPPPRRSSTKTIPHLKNTMTTTTTGGVPARRRHPVPLRQDARLQERGGCAPPVERKHCRWG